MRFLDIHPFVRYARKMTITHKMAYPVYRPYDARLFFTKSGKGEIEVSDQTYSMHKGSTLLINAGMEYRCKTPENSVTYLIFNFDFTQSHKYIQVPICPSKKKKFDIKRLIEAVSFEDELEMNHVVYASNIAGIENNAEKLVNEYSKKLIGYELKSSCLMAEILIELLRKTKVTVNACPDMTKKVLDYIHKNYALPLTNGSIAELFGFHPNYLSSLIKMSTGIPMHKYILQVRLLHAVELLETGLISIGEIAEKCGFCDVYYFSKYFKSVMHVTPTEFKNSLFK